MSPNTESAAPAAPTEDVAKTAPEQVKAVPAHGIVRVTVRKVEPVLGQPDGLGGLLGEITFVDQFGRSVNTRFTPGAADINDLVGQAFSGGIVVPVPPPKAEPEVKASEDRPAAAPAD